MIIDKAKFALLIVAGLCASYSSAAQTNEEHNSNRANQNSLPQVNRRSGFNRKEDKYSPGWFSFKFETGSSPFQVPTTSLHISYAYEINSPTAPAQTYSDSVHLKGSVNSRTYNFGCELAIPKLPFIGFNFFVYDSYLPNTNFGDSYAWEIQVGYSIRISERLRLKPSLSFDFNNSSIWFPRSIDNHYVDLYIFGEKFPYSYQYRFHGSTRTGTNEKVETSFNQKTKLEKFRIELSYSISHRISIQANVGYVHRFYEEQSLRIGRSLYLPLDAPGLDLGSGVQPARLFSYDGFYWNVGVSFTL
jgi:hypothetical protein